MKKQNNNTETIIRYSQKDLLGMKIKRLRAHYKDVFKVHFCTEPPEGEEKDWSLGPYLKTVQNCLYVVAEDTTRRN